MPCIDHFPDWDEALREYKTSRDPAVRAAFEARLRDAFFIVCFTLPQADSGRTGAERMIATANTGARMLTYFTSEDRLPESEGSDTTTVTFQDIYEELRVSENFAGVVINASDKSLANTLALTRANVYRIAGAEEADAAGGDPFYKVSAMAHMKYTRFSAPKEAPRQLAAELRAALRKQSGIREAYYLVAHRDGEQPLPFFAVDFDGDEASVQKTVSEIVGRHLVRTVFTVVKTDEKLLKIARRTARPIYSRDAAEAASAYESGMAREGGSGEPEERAEKEDGSRLGKLRLSDLLGGLDLTEGKICLEFRGAGAWPTGMELALADVIRKMPGAREAYLSETRVAGRSEKRLYLLLIDCDGDEETVAGELAAAAKPYMKDGDRFEAAKADEWALGRMRPIAEPIYIREDVRAALPEETRPNGAFEDWNEIYKAFRENPGDEDARAAFGKKLYNSSYFAAFGEGGEPVTAGRAKDGRPLAAAFTDMRELRKLIRGESMSAAMSWEALRAAVLRDGRLGGIVINPRGNAYGVLSEDLERMPAGESEPSLRERDMRAALGAATECPQTFTDALAKMLGELPNVYEAFILSAVPADAGDGTGESNEDGVMAVLVDYDGDHAAGRPIFEKIDALARRHWPELKKCLGCAKATDEALWKARKISEPIFKRERALPPLFENWDEELESYSEEISRETSEAFERKLCACGYILPFFRFDDDGESGVVLPDTAKMDGVGKLLAVYTDIGKMGEDEAAVCEYCARASFQRLYDHVMAREWGVKGLVINPDSGNRSVTVTRREMEHIGRLYGLRAKKPPPPNGGRGKPKRKR
jgi:hypothetical protein